MEPFGEALKRLRSSAGLTQQQFVDGLPGAFARSTIANIEAGREAPSERLWAAVAQGYPVLADQLEEAYRDARRHVGGRTEGDPGGEGGSSLLTSRLGGPFTIERLDLIYVFRESRSPEEIIEVRAVKALRDGADSYLLKMKASGTPDFHMAPEVLWGGRIADSVRTDGQGQTIYLRQVIFEPGLRRGARHTFALRSWVERDPDPDTSVSVMLSLPAQQVGIHLNFLGPRPLAAWQYGPVADESLAPEAPDHPAAERLDVGKDGLVSTVFTRPSRGAEHGISWTWD